MYRVIDINTHQLLITSNDFKSILKYLITYDPYNRYKHIITKDEVALTMGDLLKMKMNIEKVTGKTITFTTNDILKEDVTHQEDVQKLFGSLDESD